MFGIATSEVSILSAVGLSALGSLAVIPTVMWALVSGAVATWIGHRYVEATDDDGYEYAALGAASCPHCDAPIGLSQLAPGRLGICGTCTRALPATWVGAMLATLAGCLAMLATFGPHLTVIPYLWLVPVLVAAAIVDLRTMLIPKRIVWVGFGVGVVLISAVSVRLGIGSAVLYALAGALAYSGFMFVLHIVNPRGLGFGDVRLALVLGLYLGWIDLRLTLFGLLLGNVAYLTYALPQRAKLGRDAAKYSPFGPGLALGAVVALCLYTVLL